MRRRVTLFIQATCLALAALSILVGFGHFAGYKPLDFKYLPFLGDQDPAQATATGQASESPSPTLGPPLRDGNSTSLEAAPAYVRAIMTPDDVAFPRLDCPAPTGNRYEYLRSNSTTRINNDERPKYFFALDLHQCAGLLPRLMGSIVETMRFLGPKHCVLSIVEGRSNDGTYEILKSLRTELEGIGVTYYFNSSDLDPMAGDRIAGLAELRNQALEPLVQYPERYTANATVLFINDVAICMEDVLELIHQRLYQGAEMTCGMDWTYVGPDPTFYDVWVARGINGDSFFEIPEDGNWNSAWNLFWNDPETSGRYNSHEPFQVFSCWNGAAVFTAKPLLEKKLKFRSKFGDECYQGEPQLFCKEMWHLGYGKIAVVPAVNLEYSDEAARKIKALKGYVSQWVDKNGENEEQSTHIDWVKNPPALIKCMSSYANQTWLPWDYQLV